MLKSGSARHLTLFFILKIALVMLSPLPIYITFRMSLSILVKMPARVLIGIALNLGRVSILTILSISVSEDDISFNLFKSLISISQVL